MLTLLFLIHRLFFSSPKPKPYPIYTNNFDNFEGNPNVNGEVSKFSASHKSSKSSLHEQTNHNCEIVQESYSQASFIAICKVSATIVVAAGSQPTNQLLRKPSNIFKMSADEKFQAAVRVIHSLPKDGPYQPSNSTKLKFYGLYKQATEGKNNTPKPGFWDVIGRAKWEAWNKLGDISKDEAMNQYVDCLKEIVETMSFNGDVEDFLDSIGPFYEFVTLQGNEMNHIKEKIEEFSSSNSSLANSLANSIANSKENSPVKAIQNGTADEGDEEEVSSSGKVEVAIETSSASYETNKANKQHRHQNGNPYKMTTDDDHDVVSVIPPPAPRHSYSQHNGYVKNGLPPDNDEDEVLLVSTSCNTPTTGAAACKEDLERDYDEGSIAHPKIKMTSSIDTVASVATSGTESEKYYSGDSEPEFDEKFAAFMANNGECFPSTSAAAIAQQQQFRSSQKLTQNAVSSESHKKSIINPTKKLNKDRTSPKNSSTTTVHTAVEAATQQTIERINRDVDHILARLRILEAAYATTAEGAIRAPAQNQTRRRRRIFGDLSPQSIAFIVMWPFAVQFLIKLIRWWWRRRRNLRMITH